MSQENVEIVREAADAYNRGDLDAALKHYDPEVEFVTVLLGNYRGKDALRRIMAENQANLPGLRYEPEEFIDAGDTVIAVAQLGGKGRVSGIGLDDLIAFCVTLREGLIVRQQTFSSKADALEAAGLSE